MKRPSFQFYPADWLGNANLRRCTHEEKGIWIDVLCLLHDQEHYGVVRWSLKEIAQAVGTSPAKLKALAAKGILKGVDSGPCAAFVYIPVSGRKPGPAVTLLPQQEGPVWFSSRMITDEYKRMVRGEGGQPKPAPESAPKGALGEGLGAPTLPTPSPYAQTTRAAVSPAASSPSSATEHGSGTTTHPGTAARVGSPAPGQSSHQPGHQPSSPQGEMAAALRPLGVNVTSANPILLQWLKEGITLAEALEAVAVARHSKPAPESIPARYLDRVIHGQRAAASNNAQRPAPSARSSQHEGRARVAAAIFQQPMQQEANHAHTLDAEFWQVN